MDVPLDEAPPPAYGEPLTPDQFDAKTREGITASARTPQPQGHWQTWDDATFAANSALLSPASSSTFSVSPSPQSASTSQSPRLADSAACALPPASIASIASPQQRRRRELPQVPSAHLTRYQSTKRDRKPPLGARSMSHGSNTRMIDGMARKQADASAAIWQAQAQVSFASVTSTSAAHTPFPPSTTSIPPPAPALAGLHLPSVSEREEREASLFGDNTAWRNNSLGDDEAPPPFTAVAPALGDVQLQEAMATLQIGTSQAQPLPDASQALAETSNANASSTSQTNPTPPPQNQPIASYNQEPNVPQPALSGKMALSAAQDQFNSAGQYSAASSQSSSTTPAHYRYSAPPAPIRVAPSPTASPTPDENSMSAPVSASAVAPPSKMSRAQSATARPYPQLGLRFNPNMVYQQNVEGKGDGNVASSPADFYSASVSSTMKNVDRRTPSMHRTSIAPSVSAPSARSSGSIYDPNGSMYGPAATPSLNQAYYAPGSGPQDGSSVRSSSPPPRSSSPYSMRGGAGPPLGSLGVIDRSGAGNPGAPDSMSGGNTGYNAQQQALLYQHALQNPPPSGNGLQRQQSVQAQSPPPRGGYYPNVPLPPPVRQQYQPPFAYPPTQQPPVLQQQQRSYTSGAPQPPWASAPLQPQYPVAPRPPIQGMYSNPQQQMPYAPRY